MRNADLCSSNPTSKAENVEATSFSRLHLALFAVGVVGWMTFVLACVGGPAWSPDGSKVLYGYRDVAHSRAAIGLYDRATRKTTTVFARPLPPDSDDEDFIVVPAWERGGTRAVLALSSVHAGDFHCVLISISIHAGAPLQAYDLGKANGCLTQDSMPQFGDTVYVGGEDGLKWVNLATGETGNKSMEGGGIEFYNHDEQPVYMREASRPVKDAENKDAKEDGYEFGTLNLKEITVAPLFTVWNSELAKIDFKDLAQAYWEPGGSRIAMVGYEEGAVKVLMLDEGKGLTGELNPDPGGKIVGLGNLVWMPGGNTLLAPAILKTAQEKKYVYALAEISLTGTPTRLTAIAPVGGADTSGDDLRTSLTTDMRVSLSPDGRWVAASPAYLGKDNLAERDRALFLIDMQNPQRKMQRIPAPKDSDKAKR